MTDIVINRCTLKIVRKGGWSWGPDPRRLLERAISSIPELIAYNLDRLWSGDESHEIAAPVRVTIPITIDELAQMATLSQPDLINHERLHMTALSGRITQALRTTPTLSTSSLAPPKTIESTSNDTKKTSKPTEIESAGDSAVLRLLLKWHAEGVIEPRLAVFSPQVLKTWYDSLIMNYLEPLSGIPSDNVANITEATFAISEQIGAPGDAERTRYLVQLVIVIVKLVADRALSSAARLKWTELDAKLKLAGELRSVDRKTDAYADRRSASLSRTKPFIRSHDTLPTTVPPSGGIDVAELLFRGTIEIDSALPFLLLGPLSRMGYLGALAATFEAAKLSQYLPAFATAAAYNVLEPPERGWLRRSSTITTAAVFAGLKQPVDNADIQSLDRNLADHISPLESARLGPLVEGHKAEQPLLLVETGSRVDNGFLLADVDGLFPLSWSLEIEGLLPTLLRCSSSITLVPPASARPALLDWLDLQNIRFITDAPPTRGETWREIRQRPGERWWTNDLRSTASKLVPLARRLEQAADDGLELWQALAIDRPTVRANQVSTLDGHLTLLTATALGTIAFGLWSQREVTLPQLALQRFGDMGARVTFTPDLVRVGLPLGRRHQDLLGHGFLEDVTDVPWLGGRLLQFSGG